MMRFILRAILILAISFSLSIDLALAQSDTFFDGIIEPSAAANVSSPVSGTLDEISVERGDTVVRGQIIARLNHKIEKAAVELAQARMAFLQRKVLRNEELHRKRLLSVHDKDEMETELRIAELQLQEAQEKLEIRIIRSPIDGVVVERFLSPGEYVGEGPILKIVRIKPLFVEVVAPAEVYGAIKKGIRVEIIPEFLSAGKYFARVIIVDRVIDAGSGTFGVRLELPNPNYRLPPGLKCKVKFPITYNLD